MYIKLNDLLHACNTNEKVRCDISIGKLKYNLEFELKYISYKTFYTASAFIMIFDKKPSIDKIAVLNELDKSRILKADIKKYVENKFVYSLSIKYVVKNSSTTDTVYFSDSVFSISRVNNLNYRMYFDTTPEKYIKKGNNLSVKKESNSEFVQYDNTIYLSKRIVFNDTLYSKYLQSTTPICKFEPYPACCGSKIMYGFPEVDRDGYDHDEDIYITSHDRYTREVLTSHKQAFFEYISQIRDNTSVFLQICLETQAWYLNYFLDSNYFTYAYQYTNANTTNTLYAFIAKPEIKEYYSRVDLVSNIVDDIKADVDNEYEQL